MAAIEQEFLRRVSVIPHHGCGLSVDVYQPDLFSLLTALEEAGLPFGYLEIFKASTQALREVRRRAPSALLEYHAEGLWVTQPDFLSRYPVNAEVETAVEHLRTLKSWWANYEGAAKQIAGYAFGTYLPPLFNRDSAEITAEHIAGVQHRLDHLAPIIEGVGPLFLLETPPLTYFGFGELDVAEFFRCVADSAPCGIVLDVGHLWTIYRYSVDHRQVSLEKFLYDFLDRFPLERVVHIHAAGLAVHHSLGSGQAALPTSNLPWWIDSHEAPIPEVLFDMLDQIVSHPGLTQAKGLALEVDNKRIPEILDEFGRFQQRFRRWNETQRPPTQPDCSSIVCSSEILATTAPPLDRRPALLDQYLTYVHTLIDRSIVDSCPLPCNWLEPDALTLYRHCYLPNEILYWGGDLRAMFPETCALLEGAGIALERFVSYWFREPREHDVPYDFFELKIGRFESFVREILPQATAAVEREAQTLRTGYHQACEQVALEGVRSQ